MSAKITAQEILHKAELSLKPKVADLVTSVKKLGETPQVDQVITCNNNALIVKAALDAYRSDVLNSARPVSLEDGKRALVLAKELQVSWDTVIKEAINKKAAIQRLPVANLTKLIGQSLKDMYSSMVGLADAVIEAAPAEVVGEITACRNEYEEVIKKAIAVYQ